MKFLIYTWLIVQVALMGATNNNLCTETCNEPSLPAKHAQYLNPDHFLPFCILPESHEILIQHISSAASQLKPRQLNPVEFFSFRKVFNTSFEDSVVKSCLTLLRSQEVSIIVYPFNYFW